MKIDIQPIIEVANDLDRQCLIMREIEALYVARYTNGTDLTIKFDINELTAMQPHRTVSEMLRVWEESIQRRYNTAKTAIETGLHPYLKVMEEVRDTSKRYIKFIDVETDEPKPLDTYEKEFYEFEMKQLKEKFGEIKFYKIC